MVGLATLAKRASEQMRPQYGYSTKSSYLPSAGTFSQGLGTQEHNEDNFHKRVPQYFFFLRQLRKNSLDDTSFLQVSASLTKKKPTETARGGGVGRGDTRKIRYFTHQVCAVGSASAVGAEEICIGGESSANPPGGS